MTTNVDLTSNKAQLPRELQTSHLTAILVLVVLIISGFNGLRVLALSREVYWLLGGAFLLCYAYIIFWLGRNVSLQGGHYLWISQLAGQQWGRLAGLCVWLCCILFVLPAYEGIFIFTHYIYPDWLPNANTTFKFTMVMLVLSTLVSFIPLHKLKYCFLAAAALYISIFILAGLLGLWSLKTGHVSAVAHSGLRNLGFYHSGNSFGMIMWALLGIECPFLLMNEVKGGERGQRQACHYVWWGILCLAVAYAFANIGILAIVPKTVTGGGSFLLVFLLSLGTWAGVVVLIGLLVIQIFIVAAILLVTSRILYIMASDKLLPAQLLHLNRHSVPDVCIFVQALSTACILLLALVVLPSTIYGPSVPVRGFSAYVLMEAIATMLWLLATSQLCAVLLYRLLRWERGRWHNNILKQRQGRLWTVIGTAGLCLLLAAYGLIATLDVSWLPALLPAPKWAYYVVMWTVLLIAACWLCTEIPYQARRLMDLKALVQSEKRLRLKLQESYTEQENLAQSQQQLLLEWDRLFREQKRLAVTDVITGLPNHREIMAQLESTLEQCRLSRESCAIFFVDLDHFKSINDTYGHRVGDCLLREVGAKLVHVMGENGAVGRYGGEEFVAFQKGYTVAKARVYAERLRQHLMREVCVCDIEEVRGRVKFQITISIGVALYPLHGTRRQELITLADKAMYRAKSMGRNRICIAEPGAKAPVMEKTDRENIPDAEIVTLQALLAMLEARDRQIFLHGQRLATIATAIARQLHCPSEESYPLRLAAMLHDLGKIGISDEILYKLEGLNEDEWMWMKKHPDIGREILARAGGGFSTVAMIVGAHHERWDGSGYPLGLEREEIPLAARILSVADAYDTMTTARPYHQPMRPEVACAELVRCMGTQFDPLIVRAFLEIVSRQALTSKVIIPGVQMGAQWERHA